MALLYGLRYTFRLIVGSIVYLKNWPHLLLGSLRDMRGETISERPFLRFRDGMELELVTGGYAGFLILFPEIWLQKCYEPTPDFTIREGDTVVDLGANMGFFSCKAAKAARNVRVLAVEPVSFYVNALRGNVRRNGLQNVAVLQAAATGKSGGTVPISIWYKPSGEPMVSTEVPMSAVRVEQETIVGLTLAEIFARGAIERCDLLKVDIEGAEFEFLADVPAGVWQRIVRVVMEVHNVQGHQPSELGDLFSAHGFEVAMRPGFGTMMLWAIKTAERRRLTHPLPQSLSPR